MTGGSGGSVGSEGVGVGVEGSADDGGTLDGGSEEILDGGSDGIEEGGADGVNVGEEV